ncbi:MAG: DUF1232 domain-containing protein [Bacteroidaceae bacterium]|nr:DUF1232 domain-containing protein [Bacteroidaceae bacterium]MBR6750259.1 DUF1232 domain-containing protein [Bacteroidaceae bacterium]
MKSRVLKYFGRGRWLRMAKSYISHPDKIKELYRSAMKYTTKGGGKKLSDNIKLLGQYISDVATRRYTSYNKYALLLVVAALIYFVTPTDLLPDFFIGGFIDDVSIVLYIIKSIDDELKRYKEHLNNLNIV